MQGTKGHQAFLRSRETAFKLIGWLSHESDA